jgi:SP family myo-inositol transporter-like MFS transporter 13
LGSFLISFIVLFCFANVLAQVSLCNAFLVVGGWIGSVLSNVPSDLFGRKNTLIANCVLMVIGGVLSCVRATADDARTTMLCLYVGRCVSGLGVGVISCVAPVLLSEISATSIRGTITTMHQVFVLHGNI